MPTPQPRKATATDLEAVLSWLHREHLEQERRGEGSFYDNRDTIARAWKHNELYVLPDGSQIAAFLVGGPSGSLDILEVRPDLRKRGFGRQLVEHYLNDIRGNGALGARVHCNPKSSIPFWTRLGFRAPDGHNMSKTKDESQDGSSRVRLAHIFRVVTPAPSAVSTVPAAVNILDPRGSTPVGQHFNTRAFRDQNSWILVDAFCSFVLTYDLLVNVSIDNIDIWRGEIQQLNVIGGDTFNGIIRLGRVAEGSRGR